MHKAEIVKLFAKTREKGFTLVPLKIYFKQGRAKMEIALASGKHNYDKRQDLHEKAAKREIERALKVASATEKLLSPRMSGAGRSFLHGTRITSVRR